MSVSVNPPKTPVTAGSNGVAAATLPNVCKMPGPPAPFVPTPLPNIGKSSDSPKGYSTTVKIGGKKVAIRGATFGSQGDMASKGTGGGLMSSNTHGPTKFVGPGSMDVKIEGKNVHLLSDPMLNNCGPSGNPANAATLMGVIQMSGMVKLIDDEACPICGKNHTFEETPATKADAGTLAANFKAELDAANVRGAAMVPPRKANASTMLGVAHCKCGKKYADQSAMTTIEFCKAADGAGMKHEEGTATYLDKDTLDPAYLAKLARVKEQIAARMGGSELFRETWAEADDKAKESYRQRNNRNHPAAYPPGTCAAQGALLVLLNDGAIPTAMTERWYSSGGNPTQAPVAFIDARGDAPVQKVEKFKVGETVPPCGACELIVPLLICDGGKTECTHAT